jgi:hypothetical protein
MLFYIDSTYLVTAQLFVRVSGITPTVDFSSFHHLNNPFDFADENGLVA